MFKINEKLISKYTQLVKDLRVPTLPFEGEGRFFTCTGACSSSCVGS